MSDQTTNTTDTSADTATGDKPAIQLQLQDLLLAAQVIQVASQRGTFKPDEFTQIGGLYDRLVAFLQESGALQPAPETTASASPASSETVAQSAPV